MAKTKDGQAKVRLSVTVSPTAKALLEKLAQREKRTVSNALDLHLLETLKGAQ